MKPKRAVFLSNQDLNLLNFRLPVMKEMLKRGWDVYAMTPPGEHSREFSRHRIIPIFYNLSRSSLNPFKELKAMLEIGRKLKELSPVLLHTFTVKPNIYGTLAGRWARVPVIVNSITGLGSFFIEDSPKAVMVRSIIKMFYRIVFRMSDGVIFQNQDDLDFFLKRRIIPSEKAFLIRGSGVNTAFWNSDFRKDNSPLRILTVSRLLRHKGIYEFFKVAEIVKNKIGNHVEFLLAGDFYDGNPYSIKREDLEGYVKRGIINYLGWLPPEDLKRVMASSHIFILLSYREGIPKTGIEALSMGLPIITTETPGCKELVEDGVNGFLVPPRDVKEPVRKLEILIGNPELRKYMSYKSREKAIKEFDENIVVEKHMRVYERLLREKGLL